MRNAAATAMSGKRDSRIRVFIVLPVEANARRHKYHVGREGVKIEAVCSRDARPRRKKGEPRAARLFSISLSKLFQLPCSSPAASFAFDAGFNISVILSACFRPR